MIAVRTFVRRVPWLEAGYRWWRRRWGNPFVQTFAIAVYGGDTPWELGPEPRARRPAMTRFDVTDVPASTVADPFVVRRGDAWHMFFEVLRSDTQRGQIGLAGSVDGWSWRYEGIVLAEPFHLSFPCVFEWDGDMYMVPETHEARSVRLYRAGTFPHGWTCIAELLSGDDYLDPSVFRYEGRWWMFVQSGAAAAPEADHVGRGTLRLFGAPDLRGPWIEHPASPVVAGDARFSRMAGRVVEHEGRWIRFAQDGARVYGRRVFAFEIVELTAHRYVERQLSEGPVLGPGRGGWNSGGMHHVDALRTERGWMGFVDGWRWELARPRQSAADLRRTGPEGIGP